MECPRSHQAAWTDSPLGFDAQGNLTPLSPFDGPRQLFDEAFAELFECSSHGEFGVKLDGVVEFASPDCWVLGPNGEKLFRT